MKKFVICAALAAAMAAPAAVAQSDYAPQKGDFGVELQFNPFSNDFKTFGNDELGLSGRYFVTDKDAIRLNIGFGIHKDINNEDYDTDNDKWITLHKNTRKGTLNFNLGYERHLVTRGRLDVYAGAQVGIGLVSYATNNEEYNSYDEVVEKYSVNALVDDNGNVEENGKGSTDFRFGLFTGVNFYVYKGLYVGAELGLNFKYSSMHSVVNKKNGEEMGKNEHKQPTGKAIDFGTKIEPALRLGWTF